MIKSKDIKKAVSEIIAENFTEKVLNSEAREDLTRPYFFIYIEDFERQSYSNTNDVVTYNVVIQYQKAPVNKLAEIGDKLSELFNYSLKLKDLYILITNNSWEIAENSIFFDFEVTFYVNKLKNEINHKLMQRVLMKYGRS